MILETHDREKRSLLTTGGGFAYSRAVLRPADAASRVHLRDDEKKAAEKMANPPFAMTLKKSVAPLDQAIGVDRLPFKMTPDLMLLVARRAVEAGCCGNVRDGLQSDLRISVSHNTIRLVTDYVGALVLARDQARADECERLVRTRGLPEIRETPSGILYLETDGAFVRTRCRDSSGSPWRENKLGMAFSSNDIRFFQRGGETCHVIQKRECIGWLGDVGTYKWHFLAPALRNGYGRHEDTVLLGDGAGWIRNLRSELFPDAHQILDIFHLFENVHEFASKVAFKKDPEKASEWAGTVCGALEDGRWRDALAEIEPHKRKKVPEGCVRLHKHIEDNRDSIDYPACRGRGWFVGSGAIESANRQVLHKRLKQAGMHWSTEGAQFVTTLRCKLLSGLWDTEVAPAVLGHFEPGHGSGRGPPTRGGTRTRGNRRSASPCSGSPARTSSTRMPQTWRAANQCDPSEFVPGPRPVWDLTDHATQIPTV